MNDRVSQEQGQVQSPVVNADTPAGGPGVDAFASNDQDTSDAQMFADLVEDFDPVEEDTGRPNNEQLTGDLPAEAPAPDSKPAGEAVQANQPVTQQGTSQQTAAQNPATPSGPTPLTPEQLLQAQAQLQAMAQQAQAQQLQGQPGGVPEGQPIPSQTDLNAQYQNFFNQSVGALEQVYQFAPEVAEELDTTPSKVLPKLAATLHMQVLTAAVTQVANMFPSLMEMHMDRTSHVKATEERFFTEYPALREHSPMVQRIAQAYRAINPNATYEQIAPEVAAMAMVQARIPAPTPQADPVLTKPVTPTSQRGAPPAPSQTQQKSVWDELITDE